MYNKLFTKILDSSIWLAPDHTRLVWITFLAAMDEDGFVQYATVANVAARARVTVEAAQAAIDELESEEPSTATEDDDGRRIERVPGGWMVLNSAKYREMVHRVKVREQNRVRAERFRNRHNAADSRVITHNNANVTQNNAAPSVSVSDIVKDGGQGETIRLPFESEAFRSAWEDWLAHRREIKKPVTKTQGKAQLSQLGEMKESKAIEMIRYTISKGWQGLREPEGDSPKSKFQKTDKNTGWAPKSPPVNPEPVDPSVYEKGAQAMREFKKTL